MANGTKRFTDSGTSLEKYWKLIKTIRVKIYRFALFYLPKPFEADAFVWTALPISKWKCVMINRITIHTYGTSYNLNVLWNWIRWIDLVMKTWPQTGIFAVNCEIGTADKKNVTLLGIQTDGTWNQKKRERERKKIYVWKYR